MRKLLKYPIYIVSKGRSVKGLTWRYFLKENIPFLIAVEPQEYDEYCKNISSEFIYKLPFSNLGLGSFPARNACWEHSIKNGHDKHFIFDDNIYGFNELIAGKRSKTETFKCLKFVEDMSEKYSRLAIIGYNYNTFARDINIPYSFNVHVYSGMLINNKIPFRWRLKYNEDVDLCLQVLHAKWNTILLHRYLINKVSTLAKMKGGNQTELYKDNDYGKKMLKSKSLQMIWPQYVKIVHRFGRPHHQVLWRNHFKHALLKNKNNNEIEAEMLNQGVGCGEDGEKSN